MTLTKNYCVLLKNGKKSLEVTEVFMKQKIQFQISSP